MTKEEVKQEARQQDVAPEVRGAIRRRQYPAGRRRMIAEVGTADVVITNPTHFAVALRYDGSRPAPEVVAKGEDLVAAGDPRGGREHDVTVLTNPPLARALYREVELGQMMPDSFFSGRGRGACVRVPHGRAQAASAAARGWPCGGRLRSDRGFVSRLNPPLRSRLRDRRANLVPSSRPRLPPGHAHHASPHLPGDC